VSFTGAGHFPCFSDKENLAISSARTVALMRASSSTCYRRPPQMASEPRPCAVRLAAAAGSASGQSQYHRAMERQWSLWSHQRTVLMGEVTRPDPLYFAPGARVQSSPQARVKRRNRPWRWFASQAS